MPFVTAAGVQVNFPFEPYPCQVTYMEKVITCLKQGYNGILESPTGTGKTLCLLCSSLAWLEGKKAQAKNQCWNADQMAGGFGDNPSVGVDNDFRQELAKQLEDCVGSWGNDTGAPKIIFASRTHSQLSQAIQELKRTAYSHFNVAIIGSREQLCIHPQIIKETSNTAKVHMCRAKVTVRSCHFYNQVENGKGNFTNKIMDIEDLVAVGQKLNVCPYYTARELKKDADIIFMPYNYLLDPKTRKAHGIDLQNNIVIFDEAHNLEKICEESASFDLTSADLAGAISELTTVLERLQAQHTSDDSVPFTGDPESKPVEEFSLGEALDIKAKLLQLEKVIDGMSVPSAGLTLPGNHIFEIFDKINLTFENKTLIGNIIEKMITNLTNEATSSVFSSRGNGLSKILDIIKIVFSREPADFAPVSNHRNVISKHYRVHVKDDTQTGKNKLADGWGKMSSAKTGRVLSYWCFSPGHAMDDLKSHGVKSIILTSGTLSPIASFVTEMGIDFKIQLENPHVISREQVFVGTLAKGPDGVILNSSYENRSRDDYQLSLGNTIVNFSRAVPNGLLLFFPSYPLMEKCLDNWQRAGIWARIENQKTIFVEPKTKAEFNTAMDGYYERVNDASGKGAVFAAVCRGKVSEGLDFSDSNGRAVVITGLPYPPMMDPKVVLKMKFLDDIVRQAGKGLTGQDWYRLQASRAVNQAIGRVIRHRQDYGAIILCDTRFCGSGYAEQLPAWLRPCIRNFSNFGLALRDMTNFFKNAEKMFPTPGATRKRKKPGDLGCQGAYFMPTEARSLPVGTLTKASAVETHVSSLRPQPATGGDSSFTRMLMQYDGIPAQPARTAPSRAVGLLGALSEVEHRPVYSSVNIGGQTPVRQTTGLSSAEEIKQRKKIVIKPREDGAAAATATRENVNVAELYLAEVKRALSTESYQQFSTALRAYKATGDFMAVVPCVVDVFGSDPRNHHLLKYFCRFVRPGDRDKYRDVCTGITGQDCSSRTHSSSGGNENTQQRTAPVDRVAPLSSTPKPNPCVDTRQHLSTANHLTVANHLSGLPAASCGNPATSRSTSEIPETTVTAAPINLLSGTSHSMDLNLKMQFDSLKSGYKCCRCALDAKVPYRAKCSHICCRECWNIINQQSRRCPKCQNEVSRPSLKRIFFSSGPDY